MLKIAFFLLAGTLSEHAGARCLSNDKTPLFSREIAALQAEKTCEVKVQFFLDPNKNTPPELILKDSKLAYSWSLKVNSTLSINLSAQGASETDQVILEPKEILDYTVYRWIVSDAKAARNFEEAIKSSKTLPKVLSDYCGSTIYIDQKVEY